MRRKLIFFSLPLVNFTGENFTIWKISRNENITKLLEAVDQNRFFFFSKSLHYCNNLLHRSIPCVISFKKMYTFVALSSVLYEIR